MQESKDAFFRTDYQRLPLLHGNEPSESFSVYDQMISAKKDTTAKKPHDKYKLSKE